MATGDRRELKGVGYELFMLLLSILSVVNLAFLVVARIVNPGGGPAQEVDPGDGHHHRRRSSSSTSSTGW